MLGASAVHFGASGLLPLIHCIQGMSQPTYRELNISILLINYSKVLFFIYIKKFKIFSQTSIN